MNRTKVINTLSGGTGGGWTAIYLGEGSYGVITGSETVVDGGTKRGLYLQFTSAVSIYSALFRNTSVPIFATYGSSVRVSGVSFSNTASANIVDVHYNSTCYLANAVNNDATTKIARVYYNVNAVETGAHTNVSFSPPVGTLGNGDSRWL
jgi:hypothetical protein